MDNNRRFEITNKIITVEQIKEAADYIEKTKNYYCQLIKDDKERNDNKSFDDATYKYYTSYLPKAEYTVRYTDGREFKTEDVELFKDTLNEPQFIDKIGEYIYVSYKDNELNEVTEHTMHVFLTFEGKLVFFKTSDMHMADPAYNLNSYLRGILERGDDRYSGVVKNRFFIKNIIGLAAGLILTLIIFFIMLAIRSQGSDVFDSLFATSFTLSGLGWICAFAFGSLLVAPIVDNLYKEIEKDVSIVYAKARMNSRYKDEYSKYNEILIGENYNNLEKRKTIENLYKISKVIILIRLIISVIIVISLSVMQ